MTSSTNPYTSFTITQAFLGAPLQFQPALESTEMEELIDLYVTGSASKQNKLSEITLDFFTNAVVDINTGALTRTYHVAPQWSTNVFEQSPVSQSSTSSPMFTTSPNSSINLGGSTHGSFSMTPPTKSRGRVVKKAKKETKKSEEIRLPGFSIMTKDGIDVTNSAGRGTKTKEQREHAHLMRIMKACPSCKRKKIRCDPSHRRSDDMSRTTTNSSSSSVAASHPKPSPPTTMPSLTPQTSFASASTPSFSPFNTTDDFVLFPESSWDIDMPLSGLDTQDLGEFNFDINDLNQFNDPIWNVSSDAQTSYSHFQNNLGHTPDPYGGDLLASSIGGGTPVHTRPHSSAPAGGSGLDLSFQGSWLHDVPAVSPMTQSHAQGFFPDGSLQQPQQFQNVTTDASPLSSTSDWDILAASIYASPAQPGEVDTPASSLSSDSSQIRTRKRRAVGEDDTKSTLPLANQRGSASGIEVDASDQPHPGGLGQASSSSRNAQGVPTSRVPPSDLEHLPSETPPTITGFAKVCQSASSALQMENSRSSEAASLASELQQLQAVLQQVSDANADLSGSQAQLQTLGSLLRTVLDTGDSKPSRRRFNKLDPEYRADFLRECQIQARRLVRSLCATINNVEVQNTDTSSTADGPMLTSGRNVHLFAPEADVGPHSSPDSLDSDVSMWVESTSHWQLSSSGSSLADAAASPSSFLDRSSDIGVRAHRHSSYGAENSATIDQAVVDYSSNSTYSDVVAAAGNDAIQVRPSEDANSHANSLVSQLVQTNALTTLRNTETSQESPLVLQTSPVASYAGQRSQSSAAYQLVLPLLATLFASCIASSSGVHASLSPGLQYFFASFALSYLLPAPPSMLNSAFDLASMVLAALAAAPLFSTLDSLRQMSSHWIGTDPTVAIVKLTLVAVMTAQLPYIIGRVFEADTAARLGVAVMGLLARFDCQGCQTTSLSMAFPEEESYSASRREGSRMPLWLDAMMGLSPVVVD